MTGESLEFEPEDDEDETTIDKILAAQPWLKIKNVDKPTVKLIISLNDKIVYHGPNALNIDKYPYVPLQCYVDQDLQSPAWRKQGIIRNLRDPQFLYNMRKIIELQILQSSLNAGWIYPVDVVTDPKAFRQSDGGNGFLIPLKKGHSPAEIQRIEPVAIPPTLLELSKSLASDLTAISAVNEELLGSATDDKAGILSMLRQGASLTTLQTIFDKLDYSQRLFGNIRMQAIRKNFSKAKVRSILGRDPDPKFWSGYSLKYSLAVEEGNFSTTQRQMELQQLLHFKQIGMPIPNKTILNAAFIIDKKNIEKQMEEEQQQQMQAQQAQAQAEEKKQNMEMMLAFAKAKVDIARESDLKASAAQKMAKIKDLGAEADYKNAKADMEMVKTMIELEDLDLANLRRNVELAEYLKSSQKFMNNDENITQRQI